MKEKTMRRLTNEEARQAAALRRELFDKIKNKKLMLDTSAQKKNLIKRLERIHLKKWLSGKSNNTALGGDVTYIGDGFRLRFSPLYFVA